MTHKGNTSIIIQMKVFDDQITLWNGGSLPPVEKEKLEIPVFEEVRGGMMATIKREQFMAIQAKGGDAGNGKDVVDVVIDDVVEKLSDRQVVIYKMIRKSVADGVVETASSL